MKLTDQNLDDLGDDIHAYLLDDDVAMQYLRKIPHDFRIPFMLYRINEKLNLLIAANIEEDD